MRGFAGICLVTIAFAVPPPCAASEFRSAGKTVHAAVYRPQSSERAPLILLLHGAAGPESPNFPYAALAKTLAKRGFYIELPHYFDAAKRNGRGGEEPYGIWIAALRDEIDSCRKRPGIDAGKVALIGFSLGASLALAAASDGLKVSALVECAGSLPDAYFARLQGLPPLLILQNRGDTVMPVFNAEQLVRLCNMRHYVCEAAFGSGTAHGLPAPESESIDRIARFIASHVQ